MIFDIQYVNEELPTDSKNPKSCLYWIYLDGVHEDPKTSGYIGVSIKGASARFKEHIYAAKSGSNSIVHRAIRKYGDSIQCKEILLADPEFCLLAEEMLRPVQEMKGTWNISKGGVSGRLGTTQSEEAKTHLSEMNSGEKSWLFGKKGKDHPVFGKKASEESKAIRKIACKNNRFTEEAKIKAAEYSKSLKPWEKQAARRNAFAWALAPEVYDMLKIGTSQLNTASKLSLTVSNIVTVIKNINTGWNPNTDEAYLSWLSEYKAKDKNGPQST